MLGVVALVGAVIGFGWMTRDQSPSVVEPPVVDAPTAAGPLTPHFLRNPAAVVSTDGVIAAAWIEEDPSGSPWIYVGAASPLLPAEPVVVRVAKAREGEVIVSWDAEAIVLRVQGAVRLVPLPLNDAGRLLRCCDI